MKPWSAKLPPLSGRALTGIGAGALVGSFYIGTGDIAIATKMGALFGMDMWWTFFVLGLAGWTLMDMSTRYYLRFGRTPLSIFKEVHPVFSIYLFVTVVVTTIIGAYSQWNTCAHVLGTLNPAIATEVGGTLAALTATGLLVLGVYRRVELDPAVDALTATGLLVLGVYRRVELFFVVALIVLIGLFAAAAAAADAPWSDAPAGLLPNVPESGRQEWLGLIQQNAGSLINAWLILIYPYTMIEKGWRSTRPLGQALILQRSRWDYGVGIAAAGIVALPVMAAAAAVARPFGIVPENGTELAALLEPLAGGSARLLFLAGFFIAAWTAGIGWMVCGAYAMLDLGNIKVRMESRSFRQAILVFVVASASLLFLRINPVYGIRIFTVLLAVVFPVVALVMVWRISRPDMGYFRWSLGSVRGAVVVGLDIFALAVSLFVGWGIMSRFF